MIQRPQTILLLVVFVSLLITTQCPMWYKSGEPDRPYAEAEKAYCITSWGFEELGPAGGLVNSAAFPYALVGWLALLAAGIAAYEVSRFKNRTMQLHLGLLNTLLIAVMIGLLAYLTVQKDKYLLPDVSGHYTLGPVFPVLALVSNLLANYCIRKDEKLVRAADRMR